MLSAFALGIALLVAVIFLSRWYVSTSPKTLVKVLKWVIFGLVVAVVAWLAFTGKFVAAVAALPAILMWFMRMFTGLRYAQMFARLFGLGRGWQSPGAAEPPGAGQGSDVRTRFVVMHLDHASGHVSGQVLDGRFAGRSLENLSVEDLIELLREAQADPDSVRVVEGYLERRDPNWRGYQSEDQQSSPHTDPGTMSRDEAYKVLGLKKGADDNAVKAAHRRLMSALHPDKGGSDYLAQQINRAKDVLLKS